MIWGELKLRTLQLMFSNEGTALTADDNNQDYLDAMPGIANAALGQVTQIGLPLRQKWVVEISEAATAPVEIPGELKLPAAAVRYKLAMRDYCPDFRAFDPGQIFLERYGGYGLADNWEAENNDTFVIPGDSPCRYTLYYLAYPQELTAATPDTEQLKVERDVAEILPLYMAGALYKDDNLAMAVQFRNEFEDALTKLQYARQKQRCGGGAYKNTTGWW